MRVHLAIIPSADEALCDLGTFAFAASHLFYTDRKHSPAAVGLLFLIERLNEIYTKVQVMISPPHLATAILHCVSGRWGLYLNKYVAASSSDTIEAPGGNVPFLLEKILVELQVGRYMGPILTGPLDDILAGQRPTGGGRIGGDGRGKVSRGGGSGVLALKSKKVGSPGG